jgi:hypothetical protein
MSAIEWRLLEQLLAADPAGRLSVLVAVATVLVAFALAGLVIARAVRASLGAGSAARITRPDVRLSSAEPAPPTAARHRPLVGPVAARAPGAGHGRSPRVA